SNFILKLNLRSGGGNMAGVPELPEVEVLARHLARVLPGRTIRSVEVRRARVARPTPEAELQAVLAGATFQTITRRAKYLVFTLRRRGREGAATLVGHLGMTGRMYLQRARAPLARHAAVVLRLGKEDFVFEDTRYFGRLTLDDSVLGALGPEPLSDAFSVEAFAAALGRSSQAIKVRLLDQSLVAGVGNIYACEALFRAGVSPRRAAKRLTAAQVRALRDAIREVLEEAIACGSTIPLDWPGSGRRDGLFYYGTAPEASEFYEERLRVYDREDQPCVACETPVRRMVQAARSTFFCPKCQR
ncbi:MAG: bifunctional DNA-formamidopyrimidine glycosylase/DNA-(apurinic or apyrimidinic site) lyase, partial [Verrucomicrobiota bacterium]